MKSDGVIGQNKCNIKRDEVKLSCSVSYHGNRPPAMVWKKVGDDKAITEGTNVTSSKPYIYTLKLEGDISLDNSAYVCQITETNQSSYKCYSEVIKVLCKYMSRRYQMFNST